MVAVVSDAATPSYALGVADAYLVVIEEGRSWRRALPTDAELVIGRGEGCEVRLDDPAASRRHAILRLHAGRATIVDLGSHNGTTVDGEPVSDPRVLAPGDVITICATTLTYHAPSRRARRPRTVAPEALHAHLAGELDRALSAGRRLGVLVVKLGRGASTTEAMALLAPLFRAHDVLVADGPARVTAVLPEVDEEELGGRAAAVHGLLPGATTGGAVAPDDAADPGVLLAAARDAAASALEGAHATASRSVRQLELGDHRILLAEPAMLRLYALLERIAPSELPVLVLGETGVGKESVAKAVHHLSPRRDKPSLSVNCAALPETLAESTLFGHERGAFSGAVTPQVGTFEAAHGGTLFLDEVGELSLAVQAKLLRALDGKRVQRLGAIQERPADVRIVAATNRDLRAEVAAGRFREDLYFRLSGALVRVPPLRERPRELPVLARELLAQACLRCSRSVPSIGVAAMEALTRHPWPGNVRELRHAMEFVAAALDGDEVELWHLPESIAEVPEDPAPSPPGSPPAPAPAGGSVISAAAVPTRFRPIAEELRELERRRMIQALTAAGGVQTRAAELLRMPRRTFVAKMREYDLHALFPRLP